MALMGAENPLLMETMEEKTSNDSASASQWVALIVCWKLWNEFPEGWVKIICEGGK